MNLSPTHAAERERLNKKNFIQTYTGRAFTPLAARPQDVRITDIAHALALKNRYTGHTAVPYSVAEHCVRASLIVPPEYALGALLHDAAEAYLPDIAAPLKRSVFIQRENILGHKVFETFAEAEARVLEAILIGLGENYLLPVCESEVVKRADLIMLATEVRDLMTFSGRPGDPTIEDWGLTQPPLIERIRPWVDELAELKFLERYHELTGVLPPDEVEDL